MERNGRDSARVLRSRLDVNAWIASHPSVEQVRPACCPACRAPSRPPGAPLGLIGHGTRDRQVRGPDAPDAPPRELVVRVRRYHCVGCGATVTVVPRDVLPRRHYRAQALALAFALLGLLAFTQSQVRAAVSTWRLRGAAAVGWPTLRRWIAAALDGRLGPDLRGAPPGSSRRAHAARLAQTLAGYAPPSSDASRVHQACLGAWHLG